MIRQLERSLGAAKSLTHALKSSSDILQDIIQVKILESSYQELLDSKIMIAQLIKASIIILLISFRKSYELSERFQKRVRLRQRAYVVCSCKLKTFQKELPIDCQITVTQMKYCAQCLPTTGRTTTFSKSVKPCQMYCFDTINKCFADYIVIENTWQQFIGMFYNFSWLISCTCRSR